MIAFLNGYVPTPVVLVISGACLVAGWLAGSWWMNRVYRRELAAVTERIESQAFSLPVNGTIGKEPA